MKNYTWKHIFMTTGLVVTLFYTLHAKADGLIPSAAVRTQSVFSICNTRTSTIRDVSESTKKQVYKLAGVPYGDRTMCDPRRPDGTPLPAYEVDHRISLQLGGSNDISNLQLQSYCTYNELVKGKDGKPLFKGLYDAHAKDGDETRLNTAICTKHSITPAAAQKEIYFWKNK